MSNGDESVVHKRTVWYGGHSQVRGIFFLIIFFFKIFHLQNIYALLFHQGRSVETVEVAGDVELYTLSSLQSDTEYIVTIIPLYEGNTEGPRATARFKIGRK